MTITTRPRSRAYTSLIALALTLATGAANATLIEEDDLNIIQDAGNSSDGLRFLDMSYSRGKTLADAVANAQTTYPNARVATPSEFDDLFAAASLTFPGTITAADAFATGGQVSTSLQYDEIRELQSALGATSSPGHTIIFTDPDGGLLQPDTRDIIVITVLPTNPYARMRQSAAVPANEHNGWLLVSEPAAVPEAGHTLILGMISMVGLMAVRRRIR